MADRLRLGTREWHRAAERTRFMQAMLRGQVSRAGYCRFLRSLHTIYETLEHALAHHAGQPALAPLHLPGLARTAAIAADLDVLFEGEWRRELAPAVAATDYARHLQQLEATDPLMLLAHSYVRYLGDLSGGQLLQGIVAGALALPGADGTHFYRFDEPGARALATAYREALAQLQLDSGMMTRVVAEACDAFCRHCEMFDELAAETLAVPADAPDAL